MMRRRSGSDGSSGKNLLWLLLVLLPAAALLWNEYPALVRYVRIKRM
jgi:hypothetical protein